MGYDSDGGSQDGRDEDDEEEYEEIGRGSRFLGFMFGNVNDSGDLDVNYLDEDAKEHLAALVDKLGPSLTGIDLSGKSPRTSTDAVEEDYDEKAEMLLTILILMRILWDQRLKLLLRRSICCPERNIFLLKFHWLLRSLQILCLMMKIMMKKLNKKWNVRWLKKTSMFKLSLYQGILKEKNIPRKIVELTVWTLKLPM